MTLAREIEGMKKQIAAGEEEIEASRRHIRFLVDQGMNAANDLRLLAQLQRAQESREELLNLAGVLSALSRDPRKG